MVLCDFAVGSPELRSVKRSVASDFIPYRSYQNRTGSRLRLPVATIRFAMVGAFSSSEIQTEREGKREHKWRAWREKVKKLRKMEKKAYLSASFSFSFFFHSSFSSFWFFQGCSISLFFLFFSLSSDFSRVAAFFSVWY